MEEELKKLQELEKGLIVQDNIEVEDYMDSIKRVSKYAKVDNFGYVDIDDKISKKLIIKDKIILILIVRYLANKLQEKLKREITISQETSPNEIARFSNSKKSVIMARAKELKDTRKIIVGKKKGQYSISPNYIRIFLDIISNNES